jgi:hypothetical protein
MRWIAAVSKTGDRYARAWDKSRADALCFCANEGDRFVGLFATKALADEALRPAPSQEEQSEVLIGGLVASVALVKGRAA